MIAAAGPMNAQMNPFSVVSQQLEGQFKSKRNNILWESIILLQPPSKDDNIALNKIFKFIAWRIKLYIYINLYEYKTGDVKQTKMEKSAGSKFLDPMEFWHQFYTLIWLAFVKMI